MITIDKSFTIRYSKSGVYQYADFKYSNGKLISNSFRPNWVKLNEIPSLDGIEAIEDILRIIKDFSYGNHAEIYLINGVFPEYYNNKTVTDSIESCEKSFEIFIHQLCLDFFKKEILPILEKNAWKISYSWAGYPVFIEKIDGEWDNIKSNPRDSNLIDFICNKFIKEVLQINLSIDLFSEQGYYKKESFPVFFKYLSEEDLIKLNILVKLD